MAIRARGRALRRAIQRSRHVTRRIPFIYREIRKAPGVHGYELRSGGRVRLRHHGIDAFLLDEVLHAEVYSIPAPVRQRLDARTAPLKIVDLGANIGLATKYLLRQYPAASVVAYEPDPSTVAVLRGFVADNALGDRVRLVEACAGPAEGEVQFHALGSPLSGIVDPGVHDAGKTLSLPQRDAFPDLLEADLIKMDIEGGEWAILGDPRWREIRAEAVVLEYHAHSSLSRGPEAEARDALEAIGYAVEVRERHDSTGILWAWRREAAAS
jgi:FkbM family methyltransferase